MTRSTTRRQLLGASVLPAALSLTGCGLFSQGGGAEAPGPAGAAGPYPSASPDECLSADEAAQRERPEPPEHEEMGPENEAFPDERLSEYGIALFAEGARIAANQSSDAMFLDESDTFGTVVWDTTDGSVIESFDNGLVGAIAASPDGRLLAVGGRTNVELRNSDGELTGALGGGEEPIGPLVGERISDLVFTSDSTRLIVVGADERVTVWSLDDACGIEHELDTDLETVTALAISPTDDTLALCGDGGPVELWDPATGTRTGTVDDVPGIPSGLGYADDGSLIICTDDEREDSDDGRTLQVLSPDGTLTPGPAPANSGRQWVATAPGGRVAVVATASTRVRLWERETDEVTELPRIPGGSGRLAFSPDGSTLYGASPGEGIVAWTGGDDWTRFDLP